MDEVKPVARVPTVEHREPCESRGSRTVLGAPGGEIPPGDSTDSALGRHRPKVRITFDSGRVADISGRLKSAIAQNRCAIARCAGSPTASAVIGGEIVNSGRGALS